MIADAPVRDRLRDIEIPLRARCPYTVETPLFFGHYWMRGQPLVQNARMACVDYSVAKEGRLAAYRWNGERNLSSEHFVSVAASG
jgi:hypothetical protein